MLTVERVRELALQHYNTGGDTIVECYEDKDILVLIDHVKTEEGLLRWFKTNHEIQEEARNAANWYAYGTTDEDELAEIHRAETEPVTETESDCYDYDEPFDDPCYGCQRCDHSYNCKHCEYGDDGRYESPWDVYSPSELL